MNDRSRKIADSLSEIKKSLHGTYISDAPPARPSKSHLTNLESQVSNVVDQHEDVLNHLTRQVNCYKESLTALRDRCEVLVNQNQVSAPSQSYYHTLHCSFAKLYANIV